MERETGFGPATFALARRRSTTEPLPRNHLNYLSALIIIAQNLISGNQNNEFSEIFDASIIYQNEENIATVFRGLVLKIFTI